MSETPLHTFSRSCTSIKYTFNNLLLSELLLNKKLLNIYSIIVDERDNVWELFRHLRQPFTLISTLLQKATSMENFNVYK